MLGIGGVRALRALKIPIDVYHFNEGHALFAGFELVREKVKSGKTFEHAMEASRNKLFHHASPLSGKSTYIDRLMSWEQQWRLQQQQLKQLGGSPFNMTWCAATFAELKCCRAIACGHCE